MYIIYEIKNILNNKIYIGIHKTDNMNDSYMGSGKLIKQAIKKYGKDNFTKTSLFIFEDLRFAINKEKEIVDEHFINRNDTYNISIGGGLGEKNLTV